MRLSKKGQGASNAIKSATSLGTTHRKGKSINQMKETKDIVWEYKEEISS